MSLAIETIHEEIKVRIDRDLFFNYRTPSKLHGDETRQSSYSAGFERICAAGGRVLTAKTGEHQANCWIRNCFMDEADITIPCAAISMSNTEIRRGAVSVGIRQTGVWYDSLKKGLMEETRDIRAEQTSSEGRILDISIRLKCISGAPLSLDWRNGAILQMRLAHQLMPIGGGQIRNSLSNYDVVGTHGCSASWCAAVGVVDGLTVGILVLNHGDNPESFPEWKISDEGLIEPIACCARLNFDQNRSVNWKYRIVAHSGYVNTEWCENQYQEFNRI